MTTTPTAPKIVLEDKRPLLSREFFHRRLHSLLGVWLSVYLIEHLLVNSQAGFFFKDSGEEFIRLANKLENLPFLPAIEIVFLAIPFLIHGVWGLFYLRTAAYNSHKTDGSRPALPQFPRNRAFTWQRLTSIVLVVGIVLHVVHMRFIKYPDKVRRGNESAYFVRLRQDAGLQEAANQVHANLYSTQKEIEEIVHKKWKEGQVIASTSTPGAALMLVMRETFKSPALVILYSLFVLIAAFHGFNGLWTFGITWGITRGRRSQRVSRKVTSALMILVMALGLFAIWGTYFSVVIDK